MTEGGELSPAAERETLLTNVFESSWEKLPNLISRLPQKIQLSYKKEFSRKLGLGVYFQSWDRVFKRLAEFTKTRYMDYKLNDSESRIDIVSDYGRKYRLYGEVLKELEYGKEEGNKIILNEEGASLMTVLIALRSTLPWNRTGYNEITPNSLRIEVLRQASEFVKRI